MEYKPYSLKIGLVEGCNLKCSFCGGRAIWKTKEDSKVKEIPIDLLRRICQDMATWKPNIRVELGNHGEETIHSQFMECIETIRECLPEAQITIHSNGYGLLKGGSDHLIQAFESGVNQYLIDTYHSKEKIINLCKEGVDNNNRISYFDFYNTTKDLKLFHYKGNEHKYVVVIEDLGKARDKNKLRGITNHAGNSDPIELKRLGVTSPPLPLEKRCTRPFRELVVYYNGSVSICCVDWKHECVFGKFPEDGTLKEIWNNYLSKYVRQLLFHKKRVMLPCYKCDFNGGFYHGFIKEAIPGADLDSTVECLNSLMEETKKYRSKYSKSPSIMPKPNKIKKYLKRQT